jgi:hypothetical protein
MGGYHGRILHTVKYLPVVQKAGRSEGRKQSFSNLSQTGNKCNRIRKETKRKKEERLEG